MYVYVCVVCTCDEITMVPQPCRLHHFDRIEGAGQLLLDIDAFGAVTDWVVGGDGHCGCHCVGVCATVDDGWARAI